MYLIELLKKIFRDKNLGIIIYLILNIFVVVMILSSFFASNKINGILFGIIAYLLSVSIYIDTKKERGEINHSSLYLCV